MAAFGASDYACHQWPDDTAEHRSLRAAYCAGAASACTSTESAPSAWNIDAICHDYAQRWFGDDWPSMDEEDRAELRIEAHRWFKCWAAVTSSDGGVTK